MDQKEYLRKKRERQQLIREKERRSRAAARGPLDVPFLILVIVLTLVGLATLLSASFPYAEKVYGDPLHLFIRQAIFAVLGVVVMLAVGKINYQRFRAFSNLAIWVAVILLILVLVPGIGITRNNATRWIGVGEVLTFQPSEIAKIAVILYFADTISKKRERMQTIREGILPYAVILVIIGVLMMLEPHLSGTLLIFATGAILMVVGGIRLYWVGAGVGTVAVLGWLIIGKLGYGASRIAMWLDPWQDTSDTGYQMCQSLIAIGSGGLFGLGIGRSRQKFLYLPERHNDFIFAVACEELGFVGAALIILLFMALILRGYWIALRARDRFGTLLVVGVISLFALQTFLNIAVVTGLVPCTGISLPLFSYGGTALLLQLAEMGVVLSVSRQMQAPRPE
ncbi:MAG: putative lipid II flippase FtsW [Oscillospiraceae bacterium]